MSTPAADYFNAPYGQTTLDWFTQLMWKLPIIDPAQREMGQSPAYYTFRDRRLQEVEFALHRVIEERRRILYDPQHTSTPNP